MSTTRFTPAPLKWWQRIAKSIVGALVQRGQ